MLKRFWRQWFYLIIILVLAAFLRFVGLSWAFPYHPHPDEWNMAAAITRLSWKEKLNPHFYAYGQFPLYLAYFSAKIYNLIPWLKTKAINTQEAIFFLRFWSALAGVGTVYLVYLVSQKIFSSKKLLTLALSEVEGLNFELLTAALAAFTPGLIQISHFGTTESLLSFFFILIIYLSFRILEKPNLKNFVFSGMVLGLALGTKITSFLFAVPIIITWGVNFLKEIKKKNFPGGASTAKKLLLLLITTAIFTVISSPYLILEFQESQRILFYEAQVAAGKIPVFYTRQFFNTLPGLFQLQKIFPPTLGWPIFIFGTLGITLSLFLLIKPDKDKKITLNFKLQLLTLNFAFFTYFLSQAFLFCKWTRFMAPTFAFFPIFAALFWQKILLLTKNQKSLFFIFYFLFFISLIPGLIFSSIYLHPDVRFTASEWIYKNIPSGSFVLSETGNVVDIPVPLLKSSFPPPTSHFSPVSFDFYHLDENPELFNQLLEHLEKADYIFVPSKRLYANALRLPEKFPRTAKYYQLLFPGNLGFEKIKKFSPFPRLEIRKLVPSLSRDWSLEISDEQSEETFSVFDHPVIRIYKKTVKLTKGDYENLFK